ncbi:MAG: type II toxin-antitoxin system VapC family toxin [Pseudomonadota bacterium]
MIVIDASLAAKFVIAEADTATARHWFAALVEDVAAPDLIAIEVSQAIVRRVNMRDASVVAGRNALDEWQAILRAGGITLLRTTLADVGSAAELAMTLGHPIKDCIYLVLAMAQDCELATCDVRFATKARAVYPAVKLLTDYGN